MVQRGRFSRAHEVSTDGVEWCPASDASNIFPMRTQNELATTESASVSPAPEVGEEDRSRPIPNSNAQNWYYSFLGEKCGPVSSRELERLASHGKISSESLIWSKGMPAWEKATDVPQIANLMRQVTIDVKQTKAKGGEKSMPHDGVALAKRSMAWLKFITLFGFGFGALITFSGVWLTASGFEEGGASNMLDRLSGAQKISVGLTSVVRGMTELYGVNLCNKLRVSLAAFLGD